MTMVNLEDAAKWRRYEEFRNCQIRYNEIMREVKLMITAPLREFVFELGAIPSKIATIDLSLYPEKSWILSRQREISTLTVKIDGLASQLKQDGMELPD